MYDSKENRIEDRIVSINQPYVQFIVRGKRNAEAEFGAKLAISLVDGYAYIEELSWNAFNESNTLQELVEKYRRRFSYYPEAVIADKIYRSRENISCCKN